MASGGLKSINQEEGNWPSISPCTEVALKHSTRNVLV